jgi:ankyrin repeat protein
MKRALDELFTAVIADDLSLSRKLLKQEPQLAKATIEHSHLYWEIPHWIYAGDTALHAAAAGYRVKLAELLLKEGADPKAAANHRRSQPLHYAADGRPGSDSWSPGKQVETIKTLLEAGAEVDAADANGATPLHRAVRTRSAAAVRLLLDSGADPTVKNKPGSTSFHLAVQNTGRGGSGVEEAKAAQREIIEIFLQHGLKPTLKDARGRSVIDWARSDWIREMLSS